MNRRNFAWAVASVTAAVLVIVVVTAVLVSAAKSSAIRDTQVTNTQTLDNTDQTLKLIQSCTTPGEECYEDGQRRTAQAVGDINRVIVLAAACSVGLDPQLPVAERQTQISSCVIQRLSAKP
jgi:hypothetical protein